MSYLDNMKDGSGSIFPNEKKSEKSPDMSGHIKIDGKLYKVAGWKKDGQRGQFYSLKVTLNEDSPKQVTVPTYKDLPF
jgi:hypothetical protein